MHCTWCARWEKQQIYERISQSRVDVYHPLTLGWFFTVSWKLWLFTWWARSLLGVSLPSFLPLSHKQVGLRSWGHPSWTEILCGNATTKLKNKGQRRMGHLLQIWANNFNSALFASCHLRKIFHLPFSLVAAPLLYYGVINNGQTSSDNVTLPLPLPVQEDFSLPEE